LDEPFELQPNTELIVTVLPPQLSAEEDADWLLLSGMGLEAAYGDDDPAYPLALIKEENPDYEGG